MEHKYSREQPRNLDEKTFFSAYHEEYSVLFYVLDGSLVFIIYEAASSPFYLHGSVDSNLSIIPHLQILILMNETGDPVA